MLQVRPIAVLELLDKGEQDDKILAVPLSGPFSDVTGLESLNAKYPGATDIVKPAFLNPSLTAPERTTARVEGWILGVT